jgi:hypothetical protein
VSEIMTENMCRYSGDRDQAIVSYLYGDDSGPDPAERAAFDAHLAVCERCRAELAAFENVRVSLAQWSPPERVGVRPAAAAWESPAGGPIRLQAGPAAPDPGGVWWSRVPAWAQVAAAALCIGVGAGAANVQVRYDANGLQVSTGWLGAPAPVAQPVAGPAEAEALWRAELASLEERLRSELPAAAPPATAEAVSNDTIRRVRALVDESERRQQRELALRLAEAVREASVQRQADLVRIDRNIGAMQNNTGREMLRQRNEMLNYVTVRTALQRPQ